MPAEEKKLRSFGDLYDVSQQAAPAKTTPRRSAARVVRSQPAEDGGQSDSQLVSPSVGQPTDQPTSQAVSQSDGPLTDHPPRTRPRAAPSTAAAHLRARPAFVPVSFKGDPAKVKALKLWALQNDQRLQDLFDQALTDLMRKLGVSEDEGHGA